MRVILGTSFSRDLPFNAVLFSDCAFSVLEEVLVCIGLNRGSIGRLGVDVHLRILGWGLRFLRLALFDLCDLEAFKLLGSILDWDLLHIPFERVKTLGLVDSRLEECFSSDLSLSLSGLVGLSLFLVLNDSAESDSVNILEDLVVPLHVLLNHCLLFELNSFDLFGKSLVGKLLPFGMIKSFNVCLSDLVFTDLERAHCLSLLDNSVLFGLGLNESKALLSSVDLIVVLSSSSVSDGKSSLSSFDSVSVLHEFDGLLALKFLSVKLCLSQLVLEKSSLELGVILLSSFDNGFIELLGEEWWQFVHLWGHPEELCLG